jgi:hypothetical protein
MQALGADGSGSFSNIIAALNWYVDRQLQHQLYLEQQHAHCCLSPQTIQALAS